jgi:hypothetical protein
LLDPDTEDVADLAAVQVAASVDHQDFTRLNGFDYAEFGGVRHIAGDFAGLDAIGQASQRPGAPGHGSLRIERVQALHKCVPAAALLQHLGERRDGDSRQAFEVDRIRRAGHVVHPFAAS